MIYLADGFYMQKGSLIIIALNWADGAVNSALVKNKLRTYDWIDGLYWTDFLLREIRNPRKERRHGGKSNLSWAGLLDDSYQLDFFKNLTKSWSP